MSKKHYFGTVLLLDSKRVTQVGMKTLKRLDVIDGQQRLTTILILLREIISQAKVLGQEEVRGQVEGLEEAYLRPLTHYKLNPQSKDGDFFREYVIDDMDHLKESVQTPSQHRLVIAKEFSASGYRKKKSRDQTDSTSF